MPSSAEAELTSHQRPSGSRGLPRDAIVSIDALEELGIVSINRIGGQRWTYTTKPSMI